MANQINPAHEEFIRYLDFEIESENLIVLPLFHNCSVDKLKAYLRHEKIDLEECENFPGEKLYAFYGASRYRVPGEDEIKGINRKLEGNVPACLILNTRSIENLFRIYPFDTGSACDPSITKRTAPYKPEDIISRLHIGKQHKRANKVILHFFEDLPSYIEGELAEDKNGNFSGRYEIPEEISALKEIEELHKGRCAGDKREVCTEFIFDEIVPLNPEVLEGFFAPAADSPKIVKQIQGLGEKYRPNGFHTKFYSSQELLTTECYKTIDNFSMEYSKEKI